MPGYINEYAAAILQKWSPELQLIKNSYTEHPKFTSELAFLGIHLGLRVLWYRVVHESDGFPPAMLLDTDAFAAAPWACLFRPLAGDLAYILITGEGLPHSRRRLPELESTVVQQYFIDVHTDITVAQAKYTRQNNRYTNMGSAYSNVRSETASEVFNRWGILQGENKPLKLPMLSCEDLQSTWHIWWESLEKVQSFLTEESLPFTEFKGEGSALHDTGFTQVAAALWGMLQSQGIVCCGMEKRNVLSTFFASQKQEFFGGLSLLSGNHNILWSYILANLTGE